MVEKVEGLKVTMFWKGHMEAKILLYSAVKVDLHGIIFLLCKKGPNGTQTMVERRRA